MSDNESNTGTIEHSSMERTDVEIVIMNTSMDASSALALKGVYCC